MHKAALSSVAALDAQNDDESPYGVQVFFDLLDQSLKSNLRIAHLEQEADFCRVRARVNGRLTEYRVDSGNVVAELMAEFKSKTARASHRSEASLVFDASRDNVLCHIECFMYSTTTGSALTIQINHPRNIADTLDQTTLSTDSIAKLRMHTSQQREGLTVISSPSVELLCNTYYALLAEYNNLDTKLVSFESSQRKKVARVSHTTAIDAASIPELDSDHIFIDWHSSSDPELLNALLNVYPTATVFVQAQSSAKATRQLSDIAISERQLATNLTTLIELDHAHMICPHCAEAHDPNGAEIRMMEDHHIVANSALNYAPGCDRCEHTGFGDHRTLMSLCEVTDLLRQTIESRCMSKMTKNLQTILKKDSLAEQRKRLVSAGQMELKSLK